MALVAAIGVVACRASVSGKASAGAEGEAQADAEGSAEGGGNENANDRFDDAEGLRIAGDPSGNTPRAGASDTMLGARHDVRPSGAPTKCSCLAVALGAPTDPKMAWLSGAPKIDARTQLAIALSSEGLSCTGEPEGSLGASYWGYRWDGDNVIVIVEAARFGRPITTGAIIPKPVGEGKVYIQPLAGNVPYGRPLTGGGQRCALGNPGPRRSAPRSDIDAPAIDEY